MQYILKDTLGYRINKVANLINTHLNRCLEPYGIAIEQRAILEIIKFEPKINQTTLAKLLGKDKTTISRALNALEKKEFIIKHKTANDKRTYNIELTKKAEEILHNSLEQITNFRQSLQTQLSKQEQEKLFESLNKITAFLK
jgi:DNA-binding MarR family transcriptional regulator